MLHASLFILPVARVARAATSTGLLLRKPSLRPMVSLGTFAKTRLVFKAKAFFNTATCLSAESAPPGTLASLQADFIAFKNEVAALQREIATVKTESDKARGILLLRGVADAIEELVIMRATRLSQEQLRTVRVFSISDVRYFRQQPARVAARSVQTAAAPSAHATATATVARAVEVALGAGLRGINLELVAEAAANALAAGLTEAEAAAAANETLKQLLVTEPVVAGDLEAVAALRATRVVDLIEGYKALTAPHSLAAVKEGRKLAGRGVAGNMGATPDHAELAKANLEQYAELLFGGSSHYINVVAMVAAFRRAHAAVYAP